MIAILSMWLIYTTNITSVILVLGRLVSSLNSSQKCEPLAAIAMLGAVIELGTTAITA